MSMSNALVPIGTNDLLPAERELETMLRLADQFVKSGLMPAAIKTPAAAFTIMQTGLELRLPPMAAIRGIAVIDGKPSISADLMAALIQREHGGNAIRFVPEECDDERATLLYKRREWAKPDRFVYTIQDATKAGLTSKRNWTTYRAAMLRARALSAVAKMAFNDSCNGLYLPEELNPDLEVDESGAVVEMRSEPVRLRSVQGGDVDETTGEFRPVPDDAPGPLPQATAAKPPATPMQRLHGYANGRKLTHDDVHALAVYWHGVNSLTDLKSPELAGMIAAFDPTSDQALDDEELASEVVKAYESIERNKAAVPVPGSPEDLAAINAIANTPSSMADPEAERRRQAEEDKDTWTVMWRTARAAGLKSVDDIIRFLGHPIKDMRPDAVHAELKSRIAEQQG
jgi:hypothetical protein